MMLILLLIMQVDRHNIIAKYLEAVSNAQKELPKKELFKDLLHKLYAGNDDIVAIIDAMSAGSEHTVLNIPRNNEFHRGSADTLYNNIIIEYESRLDNASIKHACTQLAGYLLGQLRSGHEYNYILIVTDLVTWKIVAPAVEQIDQLEHLQEHELILNVIDEKSITLTLENTEEFYYWIDRFLFTSEKQKATLQNIKDGFGSSSPTFIDAVRIINDVYQNAKKYGEVQVSHQQWHRFLTIAYGSFNDTETTFSIHTYLSVLAKLLAFQVITDKDLISDEEMKGILSGTIFLDNGIRNYAENDFFHWVHKERYIEPLMKAFRLIARQVANYHFRNIDEDILKGVYQELIDLDTRHALGEYYTPDWLCERVMQEYSPQPGEKIIDPSCGSGSFLRAAIHRIRTLHPHLSAVEINNQIYGIDVHPLSVQIAKTTVIIALGLKAISKANPVHLNIILANTLLAPDGVQNLFGGDFVMTIDNEKYRVNTKVFEDLHLFDTAMEICDHLAEVSQHKKPKSQPEVTAMIRSKYHNGGLNEHTAASFYIIYKGLKKVKEAGRDSIWKFILQNIYKPHFLKERFQYVIGNPPWFTFNSIKNEDYQLILNDLATEHQVKPSKVANFSGLEIAAIFMAYCSSFLLKSGGKIAFVLPRSFFSGDQHDNSRSGTAKGYSIAKIWDLEQVSPLFNVPSCVLFANKNSNGHAALPPDGVPGLQIAGRLFKHNSNTQQAQARLKETAVQWYYSQMGASSAFTTTQYKVSAKVNPYKKLFKAGASLIPRCFYFVDVPSVRIPFKPDDIVPIKTNKQMQLQAKPPWKGLGFGSKLVEGKYLFHTATSNSLLPFALHEPLLVALPIEITQNEDGIKKINLLSVDDIMLKGDTHTGMWFYAAENIWAIHRTQRNRKIDAINYANWQNKLTAQNLNAPYLVMYNKSAKDANATIAMREQFFTEFLAEGGTFVYYTYIIEEAYYLTAILNAPTPNLLMKDFQTKGLWGYRDVAKKILDVYFPKFDKKDNIHVELATLSKLCHDKTAVFLKSQTIHRFLDTRALGTLRSQIKAMLKNELEAIDKLVKQIIA